MPVPAVAGKKAKRPSIPWQVKLALWWLERAVEKERTIKSTPDQSSKRRRKLRKFVLDRLDRSLHAVLFEYTLAKLVIGNRRCQWTQARDEDLGRYMEKRLLDISFVPLDDGTRGRPAVSQLEFRFANDLPKDSPARRLTGVIVKERRGEGFLAGFVIDGKELSDPADSIKSGFAWELAKHFGHHTEPIFHLDNEKQIFTP